MATDPEELVALANHGIMKLRSAVARAMILPPEERDAAIIVRKGALAQSTLDFEQIKHLAARWEQKEQPAPWVEYVVANPQLFKAAEPECADPGAAGFNWPTTN